MDKLPLNFIDGKNIIIDNNKLSNEVEDLEYSLEDKDFLKTLDFSKKVLFSHEIKNNNNIEGINDDIFSIQEIIDKKKKIKNAEKRNRIINLYNGYRFILENKDINKDSLKKLYEILSKDLLTYTEKSDMGEYYRNRSGIILHGGRLDGSYEETMNAKYVPNLMDKLLEYINNNNSFDKQTDYFIKSMIAHFYFVYIHPYYDINGRTSRTLSMWYLLNNMCYPYIIFNRAINYEFPKYDQAIIESKFHGNITYFIKHLLIGVKKELEKEFIIHGIDQSSNFKLSTIDYQTLHYIISMKGQKTLLDFSRMYYRDNDKMRIMDIYKEMFLPLLDKNIIQIVRYTKKKIGEGNNFEFKLNEMYLNKDDKFIKYLK